jgi:hydrophobe/amphiphile efflux-3 (HAE3) family protein
VKKVRFFARLSRDHAKAVLLLCLLLTIPVAVGISFIEVKAGQKDLIPTKHATSRTLEEVNELFGGTVNEIPMVESDQLLEYPMIKKFLLLEEEMADEVGRENYVYMEHYLTAFVLNSINEAKAQYGPLIQDVSTIIEFGEGTMVPSPTDPEKKIPFEQAIEEGVALYLQNPVAYKWIVEKRGSALLSQDGRYANVWIKVNPELSSSQRKAFAASVEDFFKDYFQGGEVPARVYISGDPSIDKDLENYVFSSTWLLAVLALLILLLLLYLTFQRFTDIFIPLAVIFISAIWIYGLMGWIGYPYTVVSAIMGPLVLGISLGNLVYMMGRFYEEFGIERNQRIASYKAVVTVGVAIFLACITTVFGFISFLFSDFDVLQEFGVMAAAGIGVCFFLSVTFLPSLMILREDRQQRKENGRVPRGVLIFSKESDSRVDRLLERVSAISQHRPGAVVVIYILLIFICVMGSFRLTTTPDLRALAPQNIPSLQAQYKEEAVFGGQQQDVVLLTGDVLQPEVLAAMLGFQEELAQSQYFDENGSGSVAELVADFVSQTGQEAGETGIEDPGTNTAASLPSTKAEVEDVLTEIGKLFGPQEGKLISEDHQAALISVFSEGAKTNQEMSDKDRILKEAAAKHFEPVGIGYQVGGITPLTVELLGNLVPTQLWTAILALCLSGLVLVIIFRSLTYGLATLSVLVAGIAVEMGFLALMGWELDMMTVLIASMIIGMGIDYGIHVTHRFLEEYSTPGAGVARALDVSVVRVGKPLLASAVCTAGAFFVIAFSRMAPIRRFGIITAVSLVVSLAASLLVLPSIITLIARRRGIYVEEADSSDAGDLRPAEANEGL